MTATAEVIRSLYSVREKHRQRIAQIDAALVLLGQDTDIDELITVSAPRTSDLRETVLAVLGARPGHALDVGELFTAAIDQGWRSGSNNPRNAFASALSRMANAGEIEKADRGHYRLAAASSAATAA